MIDKVEFCSAEIIVNWLSPIRLQGILNQVEKWLEIPHFCCHFAATFAIFEKWQQMELFNHSSIAITKRYLGLRQEEILETYDCLTF